MFWESTVSDYLLVEMYKFSILNHLDPEFTLIMLQEIQKRKLVVELGDNDIVMH